MSLPQIVSLCLLLLVLVLAVWRRLNIGVLALAASLPVVLLTGIPVTKLFEHFPGNLAVLIVGVSLLFAHLEKSGALGAIVEKIYSWVGPRHALLPWASFLVAAAFSSAGAFSTAPIAFLVPMVAFLGVRYKSMFYLCELGVVIGANASALSPLNPTGASVLAIAKKMNVHYSGWGIWACAVIAAVIVMIILQLINWRKSIAGKAFVLSPAPAHDQPHGAGPEPEPGQLRPTRGKRAYAWSSGVALLVFLVLVVFVKLDVGLTAIFLAVILQFAFRPAEKAILARIPWNSILLLCGLLTYLGLVQDIGTMDALQKMLGGLGSGLLLVLVVSYLTALLCNIESSSIGVLNLMAPIVFTAFGTSPQLFWIVCAFCIPAVLTVMNPIHVAGTLIIANSAPEQQNVVFRKLFSMSVILSLITPGVIGVLSWVL